MTPSGNKNNRSIGWGGKLLSLALALFGLFMVAGGMWLIALGGNWYYAVAGLLSLSVAVSLYKGQAVAIVWFAALFVLTLAWTIWESGNRYWGWIPRFSLILLFAIAFSFHLSRLSSKITLNQQRLTTASLVAALVLAGALGFVPHHITAASDVPQSVDDAFATNTGVGPDAAVPGTDWPSYGGNQASQRFSSATQITPDNVKSLTLAWSTHAGDLPTGSRWGKIGRAHV